MAGSLVIKNRPLGHYVLSVFSLLFRDKLPREGKICLCAPSKTIGRTADLANLLTDNFAQNLLQIDNVKIGKNSDSTLSKVSTIEIFLSTKHYSHEKNVSDRFEDFINKIKVASSRPTDFSICEIEFILSTLLKEGYTFTLSCPDWKNIEFRQSETVKGNNIDLGKISLNAQEDIQYNPCSNLDKSVNCENNSELVSNGIEPALMRMGILKSPEYKKLAKDICQHDDVIFSVDTNMFYKSQITSALLDSFVGIARSDYLDTPNWITVIASSVSIGEIEHNANMKPGTTDDKVSYRIRREACRGLQEFIEIGSCVDLEGVSLLLAGDVPAGLNFSSAGSSIIRDEIIRRHLKNFFKNIDFQKGTYFLTQDKICEMFAKAEGLNAFYLPREKLDLNQNSYKLTNLNKTQDINNISELIYELGVQFPIEINCHGNNLKSFKIEIETDWAEKSLEDWGDRKVRLTIGSNVNNLKQKLSNLDKERKKFQDKINIAEKNGNKQLKNMENKLKEIIDEINKNKKLLESEKDQSFLIEKLTDNGKRIGFNELLKGWKEINSERHVM